jgi:histidyl-tRNA synthetase
MRDFLPEDVRRREYVIGVIKEVYERYGFEPLETPAVENIETLMGKYGEEGNQLIFKILKRGLSPGIQETDVRNLTDLALRYDLTVPLARVVAQYQNELPRFFKRYQIQPVWRADRPARGRFREFYQCDVDVLGSKSMVVEAELIAAASDALVALGFDDFTIRLNHRGILERFLDRAGIPRERQTEVLIILDKMDKIGIDGTWQELLSKGIDEHSVDLSTQFIKLTSALAAEKSDKPRWNEVMLKRIPALIQADENHVGINQVSEILNLTASTSAESRIKLDPTLARGLAYYTGAIVEISVADLPGSLGGGGRYDNLVGMFLGKGVPACGFSLGLERLIVVMSERNMFPPHLASSPADVMVTIWNEESVGDSIVLATELRVAGLRVDLYPEPEKLGKQFKYASTRGIPSVAIVGENERARGEVSIKDMRSGEQRSVKRSEVADAIRAACNH